MRPTVDLWELDYVHYVPRSSIIPAFAQVIALWSTVCETVGFSRRDVRKAGLEGRIGRPDPLPNPAVYDSRRRLRRRWPGVSAALSPRRPARRTPCHPADSPDQRSSFVTQAECPLRPLVPPSIQLAAARRHVRYKPPREPCPGSGPGRKRSRSRALAAPASLTRWAQAPTGDNDLPRQTRASVRRTGRRRAYCRTRGHSAG